MPGDVLTLAALGRATLARQLLLEREPMDAVAAVERLLGLQAQVPRPPFLALWSRLARVDRQEIVGLLRARRLVRATTMRGTLHVMSAADYQRFRTTMQAGLDYGLEMMGARLDGVNLVPLIDEARRFFRTPQPFEAFRDHLATLHPKADVRAMAYAVRMKLPLVQVPADLPWAFPSNPAFIAADAWLKKPSASKDATDALVLRYLGALGPATAADVQSWLGLPGARAALDRLRPTLRVFRSEKRAELFDLPDAPRPAAETPAPVRFLPEWDSAIVSRADPRFVRQAHRQAVFRPGLRVLPTVLVDGVVEGTWRTERKRTTGTLIVELFSTPSKTVRARLQEEAEAMLRFAEPESIRVEVSIRHL